MPKQVISVEVEDSGLIIMQKMGEIIKGIKAAGPFGAASIPADIAILIADLPPIIAASQNVSKDLAEDKLEFIKGVNLGAYDLYDAVK